MTLAVNLSEIVDTLELLSDQIHAYIDKNSGEIILISEDDIAIAETDEDLESYPDWQQENLRKSRAILETDRFLELPSKFTINEYQIMKDFCSSIEDEGLRESLLKEIHGSGSFGRFKYAIHKEGIETAWYQFRRRALEVFAIDWLTAEKIAYHRGANGDGVPGKG